MNFLLIPDGLRRYARKHSKPCQENYFEGGRKLFQDLEKLFNWFDVVGAFPLARYNLDRTPEDVDALLRGALAAFGEYIKEKERDVVVVGEVHALIDRVPEYADVLSNCIVNPHENGHLKIPTSSLVLLLCYDGMRYADCLFRHYDQKQLTCHLLRWNIVFRTGCEHNFFRFSALILGADQARLVGCSRLYQEITVGEIVDAVKPVML